MDDGEKVTVYVCDQHAEDITVKQAKAAYGAKKNKIQELMEYAKSLGLEISLRESGLAVVDNDSSKPAIIENKIEKPILKEVKKPTEETTTNDPNKRIISTKALDSKNFNNVNVSAPGVPSGMPAYNTSSLSEKLSDDLLDGTAEIVVTEGRTGQPLVIPQKRVDKTGTTIINIRKSENDNSLQNRFKKMADSSMRDEMPDLVRGGYRDTTRKCPVCNGSCVVKMKEAVPCPKCGGSGLISVY